MAFSAYKHLLLSYLLIHFTFTNQLVEPQTLIAPNFDALQPFGIVRGSFSSRCPLTESNSGANFTVLNNCSFTVWAAAIPGGGKRLNSSQAWTLNVPSGTTLRVWGRTNCNFNSSGNGRCQTGDCGGVLQCQTDGSPPVAVAEFAIDQSDDLEYFYISMVNGFNIPIGLWPRSNGPPNPSKSFKDRCPDAYSYSIDDATSTFTCPGAGRASYGAIFCNF